MISAPLRASLLLVMSVVQQTPDVTTSLRPEQVRVGGRVVLTVRLAYGGPDPEAIELIDGPDLEIIDVVDRYVTSSGSPGVDAVWERDFVVIPWAVGSDDWTVEVTWPDEVTVVRVSGPQVQAAGAWGPPRSRETPKRDDSRVRDEGRPPPVSRDLRTAEGGRPGAAGRGPYPSRPGSGFDAATGWMTGGWAETAHMDPWWPEIVPELLAYDGSVTDADGQIRIEAGATPHAVFVGQQVSLFATVSVEPGAFARMGRNPEYRPPEPVDFVRIREVFGAAAFPAAHQGDLEHSYSFQHVYVPQREGELVLPAGEVVYGALGRGQQALEGSPVSVTVSPVPAGGAPPGYRGAVGRYRIQAWLEPAVVRWGDFGILRVEIAGVGNVHAIQAPVLPQMWGGEATPLRDYAWVEVREGVVGGVRVFEYAVIPTQATEVVIDPVVFPYFDPYVGDFGIAATGELTLGVIPPQ